jgi:hypothetical protein
MTELEQTLRALAAEIEWPATPELTPRFEPVRLRRRSLLLAVAAALLAIAIAFAVPQARSSILRFFHLGGVTIERVGTLPAAEQRPLAADLGTRVTPAEAEQALAAPFLLPKTSGTPVLYERLGVVSTLLGAPQPVLLSESRFTGLMKKLVGSATGVQSASIAPGLVGVWIAGGRHVFFGPELPARLAGNVLLWERDGITFRLEGRALTKPRALELAREIDGTHLP